MIPGASPHPAFLILLLCAVLQFGWASAQESQNPSPMVEHTRSHLRLTKSEPEGHRVTLTGGAVLFLPADVAKSDASPRLLVHCHGSHWLPQVAAVDAGGFACLSIQGGSGSGFYAKLFQSKDSFRDLLKEAEKVANREFGDVTLSGWSAGCGAIRAILQYRTNDALISRVIALDGIHTSYVNGRPGPLESDIETRKLEPFVRYAKQAIETREALLITHSTIFPGTYASTTETADWLLKKLDVPRKAVLKWGAIGMQQVSEARSGAFEVRGYAGNSAPDHVDHLHALSDFLKLSSTVKGEKRK